jgi:hypothetical protein
MEKPFEAAYTNGLEAETNGLHLNGTENGTPLKASA